MALTSEDLLAISNLLDTKLNARLSPFENKLNGIENELKYIQVNLLENNVIPRLETIESCYTSTYERYKDYADQLDSLFTDMEILKQAVSEHSETLKKIS